MDKFISQHDKKYGFSAEVKFMFYILLHIIELCKSYSFLTYLFLICEPGCKQAVSLDLSFTLKKSYINTYISLT